MQRCDHTAVGALIYNTQGELLMFQRGTPPWGHAGPGGHCDGDPYEEALKREVFEDVGLHVLFANLLTTFVVFKGCGRPCDDNPHHVWQFYRVEVVGTILPCEHETKDVRWYSCTEIKQLMQRTEQYLRGEIPEQDYEAVPGLDLSWYRLFQQLPELLKEGPHTEL